MNQEKATLAGGCFWCIDSAFSDLPGILSTKSGYTGGAKANPSYEEVSSGKTGHFEAVEIIFDPAIITFLQILDIFWLHIDPLDPEGQFFDRGPQYKTAIFYHDARQKELAEISKNAVQELFSLPVATQVLEAKPFYLAEEYHQKYCKKSPAHYQAYQKGHERTLKSIWEQKKEKLLSANLEVKLTPLQYKVTQQEATEPPFQNAYFQEKAEGIYVDIVSGEPLFISSDKYDSKSGWPSFIKPLDKGSITLHDDYKLGTHRTEVRGKKSNAHLGHVFPDGPDPTGLRYCINSASLRFIPKEKLKEEGYGEFSSYFNF